MKRYSKITLIILFVATSLLAQTNPMAIYRAEKDKVNDLVHTKLKVSFDFQKKQMSGEEWLTLKPHFYSVDKLILDAKAMIIHRVAMNNQNLKYDYNGQQLTIELPRRYTRDEKYTLYIKYTARPEKVKQKGSAAITSAKGLYFINPEGKDPNKPTQIWTQGETESSSCWFPTIDSPNQKTSEEIYMTVPNKYVTLSNGKLESQTKNADGTRTDYWNFKQKHAPYLFFMGVGDYVITKDHYKNIPVNYYLEKKYAPYARQIFGLTPEMIGLFSKITGVEYPWDKYSQIVGRDYVSGAMENTTAVLHGENANQVAGQLIDQNRQENTIAHELFHQWFGDLVTTESWSNITLNEGFATYGVYLWLDYKYGKDKANAYLFKQMRGYYNNPKNFNKNLVRFHYNNKEDLFDGVSYSKGAGILHMLRHYLGDDAFFAGLHKYLMDNQHGTGEAHQLRLALESVSGKDLNWFFNQWYFGSGHPKLNITDDYNTLEKTVTVTIKQTQDKVFKFPFMIDVFEGKKKTSQRVFIEKKEASFTFSYQKIPDLVLVNADGVLLCNIQETKTLKNYIYQLKYAPYYGHREEALLYVAKKQDDKKAFNALAQVLDDPFYKLRILALQHIDLINKYAKERIITKIKKMATNDPKTLVQAAAIKTLGKLTDPKLKPIFNKALKSKSYSVLGEALVAMYYIDKPLAIKKSKKLPREAREFIATPLTRIYIEAKDDSQLAFIAKSVLSGMFLNRDKDTQALYKKAFEKIGKSNNTKAIKNLVTDIVAKGKKYKQYNFDKMGVKLLRQMVQFQKDKKLSNEAENLKIIENGMGKLLE